MSKHWLNAIDGGIAVLAPHADDEVIGCGGLLAMGAGHSHPISVAYVTRMDAARRSEAHVARACLGDFEVQELDLIEGDVREDDSSVSIVREYLARRAPAAVFVPAFVDPHPDHQATHRLLGRALSSLPSDCWPSHIYCYEGFRPLHRPTHLLDITQVADRKWQALASFGSQDALYRIGEVTRTLNRYRGLTSFRRAIRFAEAFRCFPARGYCQREEVRVHGKS